MSNIIIFLYLTICYPRRWILPPWDVWQTRTRSGALLKKENNYIASSWEGVRKFDHVLRVLTVSDNNNARQFVALYFHPAASKALMIAAVIVEVARVYFVDYILLRVSIKLTDRTTVKTLSSCLL